MARVYPHPGEVKPSSNKKGKGPKEAKGNTEGDEGKKNEEGEGE